MNYRHLHRWLGTRSTARLRHATEARRNGDKIEIWIRGEILMTYESTGIIHLHRTTTATCRARINQLLPGKWMLFWRTWGHFYIETPTGEKLVLEDGLKLEAQNHGR